LIIFINYYGIYPEIINPLKKRLYPNEND